MEEKELEKKTTHPWIQMVMVKYLMMNTKCIWNSREKNLMTKMQ